MYSSLKNILELDKCMVKLVLLKLQPCYWNSGRYKFDDERVTKEELKRALDEQYGGEEELPQTNPGFNNTPFKFTKYSNAYMLVYVRDADKDKVVCNVDEKDIAEHLQIRLKKEQEEKVRKRKDKAEAHLYTIIKVITACFSMFRFHCYSFVW
jgi:hypothetical protein